MFYPVTTQQSVVVGVCGAERSQVLVKFLVRTASRGEPLFRSSRPDYIETSCRFASRSSQSTLFRSSRPDYIETCDAVTDKVRCTFKLFRSSRPDYIETPFFRLI